MKKIYSFMLMAAMLLVGTNAWAGTVTSSQALQTAFSNAQDGDVITVAGFSEVTHKLVLDVDGYVVLNLGGRDINIDPSFTANDAAILIKRGRLEITNGTITATGEFIYDLIRLNGGGASVSIDAKEDTPYSQLIVKSGVELTNAAANVLTICEATGTNNLANGARIDVMGGATLTAGKYGIKVNGSVVPPTPRNYSPYVHVHADANVIADSYAEKAVAVYSSGYGRWLIEGNCTGSTGLYAKGGQVEIVNANISSSNDQHTVPVGQGSGVTAGGSAIVVESNAAYPGDISVVISGEDTKISAVTGYAIEEKITTATTTEVDLISIQGGTLDGGDAGAVIVENTTLTEGKVAVVGGAVEGGVDQQNGTDTPTQITLDKLIPGSTTDGTDPAKADNDYLVTTTDNDGDGNNEIVVSPNASKVITLNAAGFATFSAKDKVRQIVNGDNQNEGLEVYYATQVADDELKLTAITGPAATGAVIPANTGVIFKGVANKTYSLGSNNTTPDAITSNILKPATAFADDKAEGKNIYILHGGEIWLYTGDVFKDNKAYLPFNGAATPAGAPARIKMVIAETQDVENVEFEAVKAVKFIENGQVLIKRGETIYNVQGQIVK